MGMLMATPSSSISRAKAPVVTKSESSGTKDQSIVLVADGGEKGAGYTDGHCHEKCVGAGLKLGGGIESNGTMKQGNGRIHNNEYKHLVIGHGLPASDRSDFLYLLAGLHRRVLCPYRIVRISFGTRGIKGVLIPFGHRSVMGKPSHQIGVGNKEFPVGHQIGQTFFNDLVSLFLIKTAVDDQGPFVHRSVPFGDMGFSSRYLGHIGEGLGEMQIGQGILVNPTRILFGKDRIKDIAAEIPVGSHMMIIFGGGSIFKNGVMDEIKKALAGYTVNECGGIEPNPTYETLMRCVAKVQEDSPIR
jgi:hypothetical protein